MQVTVAEQTEMLELSCMASTAVKAGVDKRLIIPNITLV